jgi:hypothetical protein
MTAEAEAIEAALVAELEAMKVERSQVRRILSHFHARFCS